MKDSKILELIEEQTSGDFAEDMEFKRVLKRKFTQQEAIQMEQLISKIYRLVHSNNKNHSCYNVHEDWRKEFTNLK